MYNYQFLQCISKIELFNPAEVNAVSFGIEVDDFANSDLLDSNWKLKVQQYIENLSNFKGLISLHGAFLDLNPASPDKKIRDVTTDRYIHSINIAKEINAKYIVFHSQLNPGIKDPVAKEIKLIRQLTFWESILNEINNTNIIILLENVYEDNPYDLLELVSRINSNQVKVCLDTGHALLNSQLSLDVWINVLKDNLEYIHFHWNNGTYDTHEPPTFDFMHQAYDCLKCNNITPKIALEYKIHNLIEEAKRITDIFI